MQENVLRQLDVSMMISTEKIALSYQSRMVCLILLAPIVFMHKENVSKQTGISPIMISRDKFALAYLP
ncbi:hypothetical protein CNR22_10135 [Sphingobacteriaceae bacterium]|nr:hypothetical protein CNR22_10135 [Sphingobacteriaceae bacterium]